MGELKEKKKRDATSLMLAVLLILLPITFYLRVQGIREAKGIEPPLYVTIMVVYLLRYTLIKRASLKSMLKLTLVIAWGALHILIRSGIRIHPLFVDLILVAGIVLFVWELIDQIRRKGSQKNLILFSGMILLGLEIYCRSRWLPGGALSHFFGVLILSIGFLVDYYRPSSQSG